MDGLAWIWAAGCLAAFIFVVVWPLRDRTERAREFQRFLAQPVLSLCGLGAVASVVAFLLWILSDGRWFGLWTLAAAFAFGIGGYSYENWSTRRRR